MTSLSLLEASLHEIYLSTATRPHEYLQGRNAYGPEASCEADPRNGRTFQHASGTRVSLSQMDRLLSA